MSKWLAEGRVVRSRRGRTERCLALSGKGAPETARIDEAVEAVNRTVEALRSTSLRGAHPFEAHAPEVRLRAPSPGARGGAGWTVLVRVPAWVGENEATAAVETVARRLPLAKSIRLSPFLIDRAPPAAPPGRDRQPGQIRRRRLGPQHRARELQ